MFLKICLDGAIHKIAKIPTNIKELVELINLLFSIDLPQAWSIFYLTSANDKIEVNNNQEYKAALYSVSSNSTLKLYIEECPSTKQRAQTSIEKIPSDQKSSIQESSNSEEKSRKVSFDIPLKDKILVNNIKEGELERLLEIDNLSEIERMNPAVEQRKKAKRIYKKLVNECLTPEESKRLKKKFESIAQNLKQEDKIWLESKIKLINEKKARSDEILQNKLEDTFDKMYTKKIDETIQILNMSKEGINLMNLVDEVRNNYSLLSEDKKEIVDNLLSRSCQKLESLKLKSSVKKAEEPKQEEKRVNKEQIKPKEDFSILKEYPEEIEKKALLLKEIFPDKDIIQIVNFIFLNIKMTNEQLVEKLMESN